MTEKQTGVVINNEEVSRAAKEQIAYILETIKRYGGANAEKLLDLLPAGFQNLYADASLRAYQERTRSAPINILADVIGRAGSRAEAVKYDEYFGTMRQQLKNAIEEAKTREARWKAAVALHNNEDAIRTETEPIELFTLGISDGDNLPPQVAQLLLNELRVLGPTTTVPDPQTLLQVIDSRRAHPSSSPQIEKVTHELRIKNLRPQIPGLEGTSLQLYLQFLKNRRFYHMFATVGGKDQSALLFFRPPLGITTK